MLIQQPNPMRIGLPPDRTNRTILVLSPMADIAITMKNLLRVFKGVKKVSETPSIVARVVMVAAKIKKRIKKGNIFLY